MRHQPDIVRIIATDMFEVVGEGLATREMLAKVGQAAAEGVAAGVDDLRVGEDQLDERHEHPVIG